MKSVCCRLCSTRLVNKGPPTRSLSWMAAARTGRSRLPTIAGCEPLSLAPVAAPGSLLAPRRLAAMCCSSFMPTAGCFPERSSGSTKRSHHRGKFSPRLRRRHSLQQKAHWVLRVYPVAWVLLWRLRDLRSPLGLPSPRRISPDTGDGGLGLCAPPRAVWTDLLYQGPASCHIITALRRAAPSGDLLRVGQASCAVLARGIT
jgi:hypothetical protein